MRAAVNYTAGKYACFCLKIHHECSKECVVAVVVVFAERLGIAPLPLSNPPPRLLERLIQLCPFQRYHERNVDGCMLARTKLEFKHAEVKPAFTYTIWFPANDQTAHTYISAEQCYGTAALHEQDWFLPTIFWKEQLISVLVNDNYILM